MTFFTIVLVALIHNILITDIIGNSTDLLLLN
jgi:hypothetical protein